MLGLLSITHHRNDLDRPDRARGSSINPNLKNNPYSYPHRSLVNRPLSTITTDIQFRHPRQPGIPEIIHNRITHQSHRPHFDQLVAAANRLKSRFESADSLQYLKYADPGYSPFPTLADRPNVATVGEFATMSRQPAKSRGQSPRVLFTKETSPGVTERKLVGSITR